MSITVQAASQSVTVQTASQSITINTQGSFQQVAQAQVRETAPPSAEIGELWFQASTSQLTVYNGSSWQGLSLNAGHF